MRHFSVFEVQRLNSSEYNVNEMTKKQNVLDCDLVKKKKKDK